MEVLDDGADGLVALATTAEASSLDERERDAILAVCARVADRPRRALIVGAGTNDTRTTIARHEALADGRGRHRVARRRALLRAALGGGDRRPLPGRRGALAGAASSSTTSRTARGAGSARRRCSSWPAPRASSGSSRRWAGSTPTRCELLAAAPADFAVLCGDDAFLLPLLAMGARRRDRRVRRICAPSASPSLVAPRRTQAGSTRRARSRRRSCRSCSRSSPSPARRCSRRCCTRPGGSPPRRCGCRCRRASADGARAR